MAHNVRAKVCEDCGNPVVICFCFLYFSTSTPAPSSRVPITVAKHHKFY